MRVIRRKKLKKPGLLRMREPVFGSVTMSRVKSKSARISLKNHLQTMMSLPRPPLVSLAALLDGEGLQNGGKPGVFLKISKIIQSKGKAL